MIIFIITILFIIIFSLVVICAKRGGQIASLKNRVEFLEYSLEQLAEKQETGKNGES